MRRLTVKLSAGSCALIFVCVVYGLATSPDGASSIQNKSGRGDLSGKYKIVEATNPGGTAPYGGTVALKKVGDSYDVSWLIEGATEYKGLGVQMGDVLGVGYAREGRHGIVVYQVQGGKLKGKWTSSDFKGGVGVEHLEGKAGLGGVYQIVKSSTPSSKDSYTGTVTITPTGDTYRVKWELPKETYSGLGILQGDLLVVGWGTNLDGVGVLAYQISNDGLSGKWATPGETGLGVENLKKQ